MKYYNYVYLVIKIITKQITLIILFAHILCIVLSVITLYYKYSHIIILVYFIRKIKNITYAKLLDISPIVSRYELKIKIRSHT